jgi:hypothetical protein
MGEFLSVQQAHIPRHYQPDGMFEPIEQCASRFGEGPLARVTDVPALVARMDANLSPGTVGRLGTPQALCQAPGNHYRHGGLSDGDQCRVV